MTVIQGNRRLYRPRHHTWTRQAYERAIEAGIFTSQDKLELLEGVIVRKMTLNPPHAVSQCRSEKVLRRIFAQEVNVRGQLPLALGNRSEPEPDIAVVAGDPDDYAKSHPTTALLVMEIADTTLRIDRTTKAALYARAAIPEYWILNLMDRTLEVYRNPEPQQGVRLGHAYQSIVTYREEENISPLSVQNAVVVVNELLPPKEV